MRARRGLPDFAIVRLAIQEPVGLEGNRLQIRQSGPFFAAFLGNG